MAFALGPLARQADYRLAAFDTIGSTSTEALDRARGGDAGRLWIVARAQTAGHGRRGRAWETARGNLAASLLLIEPEAGREQPASLGFVAGLALEQAIAASAPGIQTRSALDGADGDGARLRLKWPNDVLVGTAKVAGILLEAVALPGGRRGIAVGIGVNVQAAPRDLPYPATSLVACGASVTAEALFAALSDAWTAQQAVWDDGRGFAQIRRRWLERAAGLGAPIAVRLGAEIFRGTFETIDEQGRLVVSAEDGSVRVVAAGDVHFGTVATAGP